MTIKHQGPTRARKGTQGRKADPNTSARNARNRIIEPGPRVGSREEQLREQMALSDIRPGDRLAHFVTHSCDPVTGCSLGCDYETPAYLKIAMLADDYTQYERSNRGREAARNLPPFTSDDLAAIVAGDIERFAPPWGTNG